MKNKQINTHIQNKKPSNKQKCVWWQDLAFRCNLLTTSLASWSSFTSDEPEPHVLHETNLNASSFQCLKMPSLPPHSLYGYHSELACLEYASISHFKVCSFSVSWSHVRSWNWNWGGFCLFSPILFTTSRCLDMPSWIKSKEI